ncbi:MAG: hypothetical protein LBH06_09150 [Rikenellaceae bacterium]|nr:hypothetical protein [Rikenellaceae bacterium]
MPQPRRFAGILYDNGDIAKYIEQFVIRKAHERKSYLDRAYMLCQGILNLARKGWLRHIDRRRVTGFMASLKDRIASATISNSSRQK